MTLVAGIALFVIGLAVGSFLNVLTLRYGGDTFLFARRIVGGRSHCPHCGETLRFFELIPLLSYLVQRGKCRRCGARLSLQYPAVELAGGLIALFVPMHLAPLFAGGEAFAWVSALWVLAFWTLLALFVIDYRLRIVPDEGVVALLLLGAAAAMLKTSYFHLTSASCIGSYAWMFGVRDSVWANHAFALAFGALFFGAIVVLTRGRAMGMGDVKLAGALGFLFGWPDVLVAMVFAFVIGGVLGVAVIARGTHGAKSAVPFVPFLALGAATLFFFGYDIARWYASLLLS